jgi:hypothetical protein
MEDFIESMELVVNVKLIKFMTQEFKLALDNANCSKFILNNSIYAFVLLVTIKSTTYVENVKMEIDMTQLLKFVSQPQLV